MHTVRPLTSLLSAGAAVALALAAPGTALADPGSGGGAPKGGGASTADGHDKGRDKPAKEEEGAQGGTTHGAPPAGGERGRGGHGQGSQAGESRGADGNSRGKGNGQGRGRDGAKPAEPAPAKPAKPAPAKPAKPARAAQPSASNDAAAAPTAANAPGDPAGNNGTIKIDTVPGDAGRANRPHPGCAFVLQFFGFDAGQTADITFTGQAPTRSAGPLLTLTGQTISTTPADGALEEGHSLTLTAADLGLVGTPTAAKGWHVKVAVDALEAPGGAKQKVFWLDCSAAEATVTEEQEESAADGDAAGSTARDATVVGTVGKDADLRGAQLEQPDAGQDVAVLSGAATREVAGAASVSGRTGAGATDVAAAAPTADGAEASTRASALPFTGPAGLAALLAGGLGAVGAGALALRAGRRRRTAASATR